MYGCEKCAELTDSPVTLESGRRLCPSCGGSVLTVQEAFDRILELKSYIREVYDGNIDLDR